MRIWIVSRIESSVFFVIYYVFLLKYCSVFCCSAHMLFPSILTFVNFDIFCSNYSFSVDFTHHQSSMLYLPRSGYHLTLYCSQLTGVYLSYWCSLNAVMLTTCSVFTTTVWIYINNQCRAPHHNQVFLRLLPTSLLVEVDKISVSCRRILIYRTSNISDCQTNCSYN